MPGDKVGVGGGVELNNIIWLVPLKYCRQTSKQRIKIWEVFDTVQMEG